MLIKYRQQSRGVDIYSTLTTNITLQEISFLKLCYFSFFTFSFPVHSAFHIKLYIQQNKALRFQKIFRINAFSIATIIQCKSPWVVLAIPKTDSEIWPPMTTYPYEYNYWSFLSFENRRFWFAAGSEMEGPMTLEGGKLKFQGSQMTGTPEQMNIIIIVANIRWLYKLRSLGEV